MVMWISRSVSLYVMWVSVYLYVHVFVSVLILVYVWVCVCVCVHPTPWPFCLSVVPVSCGKRIGTTPVRKYQQYVCSSSNLESLFFFIFGELSEKNLFEKRESFLGMINTWGCFPRSGCLLFHGAPFDISNLIFHLSLELRTKFWKTSLKVA